MKWNDVIELIMTENDGRASLQFLYEQVPNHKTVPSGDWQKTLRGVLYREVNKGRFKKIGLGVYALLDYQSQDDAYSYAVTERPASEYLNNIEDVHSAIEGMLLEIGNFFEYTTYTCDLNKSFDGKKLVELCGIKRIPDFTYPELTGIISKSDIVWFTKSRLLFPKYVYEVESTTDFTNSMFKMYQLLNFDARFVLVATERRKNIFTDRISREPFAKEANRFLFRSFENVGELYFNAVKHHDLKTKFLW